MQDYKWITKYDIGMLNFIYITTKRCTNMILIMLISRENESNPNPNITFILNYIYFLDIYFLD